MILQKDFLSDGFSIASFYAIRIAWETVQLGGLSNVGTEMGRRLASLSRVLAPLVRPCRVLRVNPRAPRRDASKLIQRVGGTSCLFGVSRFVPGPSGQLSPVCWTLNVTLQGNVLSLTHYNLIDAPTNRYVCRLELGADIKASIRIAPFCPHIGGNARFRGGPV